MKPRLQTSARRLLKVTFTLEYIHKNKKNDCSPIRLLYSSACVYCILHICKFSHVSCGIQHKRSYPWGPERLSRPRGPLRSNRAIEKKGGISQIVSLSFSFGFPSLSLTGQFVSPLFINCNMNVTVCTPRGSWAPAHNYRRPPSVMGNKFAGISPAIRLYLHAVMR